jgi:hypothetical protein
MAVSQMGGSLQAGSYILSVALLHYTLLRTIPRQRLFTAIFMSSYVLFMTFTFFCSGNHGMEVLIKGFNVLFQLKFLDAATTQHNIKSLKNYAFFISQTNPSAPDPCPISEKDSSTVIVTAASQAAHHHGNWAAKIRKPVYPHQRTFGYYSREALRLFVLYWVYVASRVAYNFAPWDLERTGFSYPWDLHAISDAVIFFFMLWTQFEICKCKVSTFIEWLYEG